LFGLQAEPGDHAAHQLGDGLVQVPAQLGEFRGEPFQPRLSLVADGGLPRIVHGVQQRGCARRIGTRDEFGQFLGQRKRFLRGLPRRQFPGTPRQRGQIGQAEPPAFPGEQPGHLGVCQRVGEYLQGGHHGGDLR